MVYFFVLCIVTAVTFFRIPISYRCQWTIASIGPLFCYSNFISFHLFKTTKGQMATDMLIVRQNMMRLIPTMNKT